MPGASACTARAPGAGFRGRRSSQLVASAKTGSSAGLVSGVSGIDAPRSSSPASLSSASGDEDSGVLAECAVAPACGSVVGAEESPSPAELSLEPLPPALVRSHHETPGRPSDSAKADGGWRGAASGCRGRWLGRSAPAPPAMARRRRPANCLAGILSSHLGACARGGWVATGSEKSPSARRPSSTVVEKRDAGAKPSWGPAINMAASCCRCSCARKRQVWSTSSSSAIASSVGGKGAGFRGREPVGSEMKVADVTRGCPGMSSEASKNSMKVFWTNARTFPKSARDIPYASLAGSVPAPRAPWGKLKLTVCSTIFRVLRAWSQKAAEHEEIHMML